MKITVEQAQFTKNASYGLISCDPENGDLLINRDGIIIARIPAAVEAKWPGTAVSLAAPEIEITPKMIAAGVDAYWSLAGMLAEPDDYAYAIISSALKSCNSIRLKEKD